MAFTEIKERNNKKYYYRVISFRKHNKISKKRKYLGVNLSKKELILKESQADKELGIVKRTNKKNVLDMLIPKIMKILKANHIKRAGIFGSYARGEQTKKSDVDILIQPTKHMGFEFVGLQFKLEDALKKKVDLVSYNGLSPHLKDRILNQEIKII